MLLNITKNQYTLPKRTLALILVLLTLLVPKLLFSKTEIPVIAITQIVAHPSIDAIREGALKALKKAGFEEARDYHCYFYNAQGNPVINSQIAQKIIGMKASVILAISTPSAQALIPHLKLNPVPLVFAAVSDPLGSQIVQTLDQNTGFITGVSDAPPLVAQVRLMQSLVPNLKTLGVLYNAGEINSVNTIKRLKQILRNTNIGLIETPVVNASMIKSAAHKMMGRVDALYVPQDNLIISAIETLIRIQHSHKLPLFTSDQGSVQQGALACAGMDYGAMGAIVGTMIEKILKGQAPGTIPIHFPDNAEAFINRDTLRKLGLSLPKLSDIKIVPLK